MAMKRVVASLCSCALLLVACVGDSPTPTNSNDGGTDSSPQGDGASCAAPKKECTKGSQTVCTDVTSDDANCGACNTVCPTGSTCKASDCACTDGTKTFCKGSNSCTDTKSDSKNCGKCGVICPNANCTNGECDRIVFVTQDAYGTGIGGVAQADAICDAAAKKGGFTGTFKAWISDGTIAPSNSFTTKSSTPYILPNGTKVANSFAALATPPLLHGIDMTEAKTAASGVKVLTNVRVNGDANTSSYHCVSWTETTTGTFFGGTSGQTSAEWTDNAAPTSCSATLANHLYCFQQ